MLEGDGDAVFKLFAELCRVLVTRGASTADKNSAALEEHTSFIVEKRGYHSYSGQSASDIFVVVPYLLRDVGFLSRHQLLRVFKLCCLVAGVPSSHYPVMSLDMAGFALDAGRFQTCVQLVQSHILSVGYSHQPFFSDQTLVVVKKGISKAGVFFGASDFDIWKDFCSGDVDAFVAEYSALFPLFADRRKSFDARYLECNKINRISRLVNSGDVAGPSGSLSSVIQKKKQDSGQSSAISVKSAGSESTVCRAKPVAKNSNPSSKAGQQKSAGGGSGSGVASTKRKKNTKKCDDDDDDDSDVIHKLKKPFKN